MSLLQHAPRFQTEEAVRLARELYGVDATASALPSERDQNFLLETTDGPPPRPRVQSRFGGASRFVLKIANATEPRALLEAQNALIDYLAPRFPFCPRVIRSSTDDRDVIEGPDGHLVRLLTWVPGVPLGTVRRHSAPLLTDLGRRLGELDSALQAFEHPAVRRSERPFQWDLAAAIETIRGWLPLVREPDWRALIEREVERIQHRAGSLASVRRSVIHNDANDYNVLVDDGPDLVTRHQRVTGIIDFGDTVHSYTIADLAVAIAYAVLDKASPLAAARQIVRGYHESFVLMDSEIAVLFDLVRLRLCLSVCVAAHQQHQRPDDKYLGISQEPIRRTLPRLLEIPPAFAEATFRDACRLPVLPRANRIVNWLEHSARDGAVEGILGGGMLEPEQVVILDLSVGSALVDGDPAENCARALGQRINDVLCDARAAVRLRRFAATARQVGVGRYLEPRILHSSPLFGSPGPPSLRSGAAGTDGERPTIHLGVDLFAPAGTPVRSPFRGVVHAFADNAVPLDYGPALSPVEGPVIILEHATNDGETFFTLYGHLTRESIEGLTLGKKIQAGEAFAAIGAEDVNGGWPPHLHLQVVVDLLDLGCGFPGDCPSGECSVWRWLSPDPTLLLRTPPEKFPEPARDKQQTIAIRRGRIGRNLSLAYREPLKIVRGWMQYLFDDTGRRYLDAYNNVPHVGHCNPRVVRAAEQQMRVLNSNTRYLHDSLTEYAERLTATLPPPLRVCYFVNSGSEANELALRLAWAHTRRRDVIVLEAAYHGNTSTLIDISPYKFDGPGGGGRQPWVHVAPMPDVFRGMFRRDIPEAGRQYADCIRSIIDALFERGAGPACFIAETCPSVGGQIVFPPGYLPAVYSHMRSAGGVCIADEVQTAYGRMGSNFYAFEDQQVVPDILVLGKPIGNGYPLGAVITTPEIAASFDNGMEFFSTFGGSTVSCAIGLAVLDLVRQEQLQAHARRVGTLLLDRLYPLRERFPLVGDVRGSGLFLGVELVKNAVTLDPAPDEADYIVNRMREEGILLGIDGPFHNVLKIRPPMPFAETDAETLAGALGRILEELD